MGTAAIGARPYRLIAVEVPENAQHVATVGEPVRETDAIRWGIRVRTETIGEHSGAIDSADDEVFDRERAMGGLEAIESLEVGLSTEGDRRVAVVTGEIDDHRIRVEFDVPGYVDGIDRYSASARRKLDLAVGRAWSAAVLGRGVE